MAFEISMHLGRCHLRAGPDVTYVHAKLMNNAGQMGANRQIISMSNYNCV
jgi:hypothetical protein